MPDPAYRVARQVARAVSAELGLTPPFDVDRVAGRFAVVLDEEVPTRSDVVVLHAPAPGERSRIVVDGGLEGSPARRRFAVAHGLGHVLLGWHPLGTPCDVSFRPWELPVTVHDLVEGEASAFARELLMPTRWIESFDSLDRPAMLARHVAERAGQAAMPAARSVALLLGSGYVWCVVDGWGRVVDAGRSPGTGVCAPRAGDELEPRAFARHAVERHRDEHEGLSILFWRFDEQRTLQLPRDRTARAVAMDIAHDLDMGDAGATVLAARVEGIAGWANEQLGTATLDGMRRTLDERARTVPELASIAEHPEFETLIGARARELVAKRLAR